MRILKPRHFLSRAAFLALGGIFLLLWAQFVHACPIRSVTGIPCPGCGISRAWFAFLSGDFVHALRFHPMFWSLVPICIFFLWEGRLFENEKLNIGILAGIGILFFIVYAIRLAAWFSGRLIF